MDCRYRDGLIVQIQKTWGRPESEKREKQKGTDAEGQLEIIGGEGVTLGQKI